MTKIKICGITNINDAKTAVKWGADALGFVFTRSPRRINPKRAAKIIGQLPIFVSKVGVFVNAKKAEVLKVLKICKLDVLQLHGEESDKYCAFLRKYCKIIKAFRIKDRSSLKNIRAYRNIDAYLFDAYDENEYGGTGKSFNIKHLKNLKLKKPVIIAGGLTNQNVKSIVRRLRPYAVDVSSRIEASPGKKSEKLMQSFIRAVKK